MMSHRINLALLAATVTLLATAPIHAQHNNENAETTASDAPFGLNRQGEPLRFPPGTEPGMPHPTFNSELPTLWLIGDSTVKEGRDTGRNGGRWGWGHEIDRYIDTTKINVENQALGGTSSRSYITGGRWEPVLEMIQPGDYLLIQFGHNDGGIDSERARIRARGTIAGNGEETLEMTNRDGETETVHTYGWYLRQYIRDARAKGATPIVCSLVPRNDWRDGKVIRGQNDTYVSWAQEAAAQEEVFFINLNHIICEQMDPLGEDFSLGALFRPDDHTHTIVLGAQLNALCVVSGVKALGDALPLNEFLLPAAEPIEPTRAANVVTGTVTAGAR